MTEPATAWVVAGAPGAGKSTDAATLLHRLVERASERDSAKLAAFGEFAARMRLDAQPAVPHLAVDNRLSAPTDLRAQVGRWRRGLRRVGRGSIWRWPSSLSQSGTGSSGISSGPSSMP